MLTHTESKLQGWRAVARRRDQIEHLIFLGRSSSQVRSGYAGAFLDLLEPEERAGVREIVLERWDGAADIGRWVQKGTLSVPANKARQIPARAAK